MTHTRSEPATLIADRLRAALNAEGARPPPSPTETSATEPPTSQPSTQPEPAPACLEEAWRRARADYERGVSAPVCAERHGLRPRTVRHRAAQEAWFRPPRPPSFREGWGAGGAPAFAGEPLAVDALMDEPPDLTLFAQASRYEAGELLLDPEPGRLARFTFRRAAEAAARDAPAEAGAWMRLAAGIARVRGPLEGDLHPHRDADRRRARYAAQLRREAEIEEGLE